MSTSISSTDHSVFVTTLLLACLLSATSWACAGPGEPVSTEAAVLAGAETLAAQGATAQDVGTRFPDSTTTYSPYLQYDYPDQVLFGDTHLHTAYSADAGLVGATTTPDDAYRFAKGQTVISSNGVAARLQRPLDFLVVADHAENLGLYAALDEESSILGGNEWAEGLRDIFAPRSKGGHG